MKQYLPAKRNKREFKVFTRFGASGIIYEFEIYKGLGTVALGDFRLGGSVVLWLIKDLSPKKGFKIYFDNWFASMPLVVHLKLTGYDSVTTLEKY
jgi:hypothetical protein